MNTLSTYDVNSAAIDFLSNMIENANGSNMSAARDELILLLPQQIQLVRALEDKTWEEAVKQREIVCELDDELHRDECNETFQEYSSALDEAEEIENRANRYGLERNALQTLLDIETEQRRREQQVLTIMSASHPRVGAGSSLHRFDDILLAKIALLSVE